MRTDAFSGQSGWEHSLKFTERRRICPMPLRLNPKLSAFLQWTVHFGLNLQKSKFSWLSKLNAYVSPTKLHIVFILISTVNLSIWITAVLINLHRSYPACFVDGPASLYKLGSKLRPVNVTWGESRIWDEPYQTQLSRTANSPNFWSAIPSRNPYQRPANPFI
jgi:hypothetical protein